MSTREYLNAASSSVPPAAGATPTLPDGVYAIGYTGDEPPVYCYTMDGETVARFLSLESRLAALTDAVREKYATADAHFRQSSAATWDAMVAADARLRALVGAQP